MTTALIGIFQNTPSTPIVDCVTCNSDGYLDGLGKYLLETFESDKDIDYLWEWCDENGCDFRSMIGEDNSPLDWESYGRLIEPIQCYGLHEFKNEAGNYDYAYVWRSDFQKWYVYSKRKEVFYSLDYALQNQYLVK